MSNAIHPGRMSPQERLAELTGILAAGLVRLWVQKSSNKSAETGEILLDLAPDQSGAAAVQPHRKERR